MSPQDPEPAGHEHHDIEFTVDGEPVVTASPDLSPIQIMELAEVDPSEHYLVQLDGRNRTSYEEHPDTPIHVHQHAKFITVSTGPTPVS